MNDYKNILSMATRGTEMIGAETRGRKNGKTVVHDFGNKILEGLDLSRIPETIKNSVSKISDVLSAAVAPKQEKTTGLDNNVVNIPRPSNRPSFSPGGPKPA